jgi:integrase
VRVEDLVRLPTPGLLIRRASPEGVGVKSTKGRRSRRVPLANRVLPLVLAMAEDKQPADLLLTTAGGAQLHRTAVLRRWTGEGPAAAAASTTCATPPPACGWRAAWTPERCRRGWAPSRSRPRTSTCISSAQGPIEPAWSG